MNEIKFCVSLKELFDNGIQYLEYGGKIVCTNEGGLCHYDLYETEDTEFGLILCDGEEVIFSKTESNHNYIEGTTLYGKKIRLSKSEYNIAIFK